MADNDNRNESKLVRELELLRAKDTARDAQIELLMAQVKALTAPREPETLIPDEWRKWAGLSAEAKTQLVADREYGPSHGDKCFKVQLAYREKRDQSGQIVTPRSEYPAVLIYAHNPPEAEACYRILCGITSSDNNVTEYLTELVTVPAAQKVA